METPATTMKWAVYLMAKKPSIQEKVYIELCDVLGPPREQRVPSLSDRKNVPFTEAVLAEVQRWASIVPGFPHRATADTVIGGYRIPKDTQVIPNLLAAHRDENFWPVPNDFDPVNFYDENLHKTKNMEYLIPFSIGAFQKIFLNFDF